MDSKWIVDRLQIWNEWHELNWIWSTKNPISENGCNFIYFMYTYHWLLCVCTLYIQSARNKGRPKFIAKNREQHKANENEEKRKKKNDKHTGNRIHLFIKHWTALNEHSMCSLWSLTLNVLNARLCLYVYRWTNLNQKKNHSNTNPYTEHHMNGRQAGMLNMFVERWIWRMVNG